MRRCFLLIALVLLFASGRAQDSSGIKLPADYLSQLSSRASELEGKLDKKTDKALAQLQRSEEKIRRKLSKLDSSKAKQVFDGAQEKYAGIKQKLSNPGKLSQYMPYLDTLKTSMKFLENNK